jgi:phosphatidylserine/phosphatidylglycerophosphate/cardiolipin synthase-like enzyme
MPKSGSSRRRKSSSRTSRKSGSRKAPTIWSLIGVVALLVVGYLANEGYIDLEEVAKYIPPDVLEDVGVSLPQEEQAPPPVIESNSGSLQVFFTTPSLVYPDERDRRTPPPSEQAMLADIDAATTSVDVAAFEYDLESVADALIRAHERGVAVRLALDRENLEKPDDSEWAGRVEAAGIPIAWEESTGFLHSKFAIIDNSIAWMGSWNFSNNGTYRNNNNLIRFTIPAIVENYAAEFAQMHEGYFGNDKESLAPNPLVQTDTMFIENYFSPQDRPQPVLVEQIQAAQQSIRFLAFSYTSDPIAEAMIERHNAGVAVQGVFETRNANGIGAEYQRLKENGVDVLEDGNCYTMHHKVIIIDDATVITGSYNFTRRAEETNDENLVIIDSPEVASQYLEEFERVYNQAQNPTRCGQ